MISNFTQRRRFADLSEQDILALAISSEEDDAQIYRSYGQMLRADYPASAKVFDAMAVEENGHRQLLIDMHRKRFGEVMPLIRREHVAGFHARRPIWLTKNLSLATIRSEALGMEAQATKFYTLAAGRTSDAATRKLLGDLAAAEAGHEKSAVGLEAQHLSGDARARRCRRAAAVYSDMGSTGACGVDGWVGIHPCAHFRHGFCHTKHPHHAAGGACRLSRGGDFDGLYRSRA